MAHFPDDFDDGDLLHTAGEVAQAAARLADSAARVDFAPLADGAPAKLLAGRNNLDLLLDVEIPVSVEVGRTELSLDQILDLVPGSVVTLQKKVEEPVDLRVNGKLIARGEVVMVDDVFGIRLTEIVEAARRIESLRRRG